MAKEERCLFLTLGHATNQVNALWKLVIILTTMTRAIRRSEAGRRADPHIRQAHHRSDAGSWRLIEGRFLNRPLGQEYLPLLDAPAAQALERLKKRLGKLNRLAVIRNNYAFHHPEIDEVEAAFEKATAGEESEDADWAIYFNKAR